MYTLRSPTPKIVFRAPPRCFLEGIAFCDTIPSISTAVSWNLNYGYSGSQKTNDHKEFL